MTNTLIRLASIEDVKKFVSITNRYGFKINLISDKYTIDAKSIMGVFSLDLSRPLTMQIEEETDPEYPEFMEEAQPYFVK
jgi:phosphocarrier protein HPr